MRKSLTFYGFLVVGAVVVMALVFRSQLAGHHGQSSTSRSGLPKQRSENVAPPILPLRAAPIELKAPVSRVSEPEGLQGFWAAWTDEHRLAAVTELARDPLWTDETVKFAREALRVKSLDPLIKNNLATGLISQRRLNQKIVGDFSTMLRDESEDLVWRDYCLQFLAALHNHEDIAEATIEAELDSVARTGTGPIVGTAVLHLSRWQESSDDERAQKFDLLLTSIAGQYAEDEVVMPTLLGAIGECGRQAHAGLVRKHTQSPISAIRRSAFAALGSIGDAHDIAMLQLAVSGSDRNGEATAAKGALARLTSRLASGQ